MPGLDMRKLANALYPEAEPAEAVPEPVLGFLARFNRQHGGLWVGGTVHVTEHAVSFVPNGINRAFHGPLAGAEIPTPDIRFVRCERGWVTDIVVVGHLAGEFRFRCFGASKIAALMAGRSAPS